MNTLLSSSHAYAIVYQVIIVVCGVGIISGLLALVEHMRSPRSGLHLPKK